MQHGKVVAVQQRCAATNCSCWLMLLLWPGFFLIHFPFHFFCMIVVAVVLFFISFCLVVGCWWWRRWWGFSFSAFCKSWKGKWHNSHLSNAVCSEHGQTASQPHTKTKTCLSQVFPLFPLLYSLSLFLMFLPTELFLSCWPSAGEENGRREQSMEQKMPGATKWVYLQKLLLLLLVVVATAIRLVGLLVFRSFVSHKHTHRHTHRFGGKKYTSINFS